MHWTRELRYNAYDKVRLAIASGELPPIISQLCADCGGHATMYDHRDYTKPLAVDPVCKGCNNRRGPGLPLPKGLSEYSNELDFTVRQNPHVTKPSKDKIFSAGGTSGGAQQYMDNIADDRYLKFCEKLAFDDLTYKGPIVSGQRRGEYFKMHDPWRMVNDVTK